MKSVVDSQTPGALGRVSNTAGNVQSDACTVHLACPMAEAMVIAAALEIVMAIRQALLTAATNVRSPVAALG